MFLLLYFSFHSFQVGSEALRSHPQGSFVVRNRAQKQPHPDFGLLKS